MSRTAHAPPMRVPAAPLGGSGSRTPREGRNDQIPSIEGSSKLELVGGVPSTRVARALPGDSGQLFDESAASPVGTHAPRPAHVEGAPGAGVLAASGDDAAHGDACDGAKTAVAHRYPNGGATQAWQDDDVESAGVRGRRSTKEGSLSDLGAPSSRTRSSCLVAGGVTWFEFVAVGLLVPVGGWIVYEQLRVEPMRQASHAALALHRLATAAALLCFAHLWTKAVLHFPNKKTRFDMVAKYVAALLVAWICYAAFLCSDPVDVETTQQEAPSPPSLGSCTQFDGSDLASCDPDYIGTFAPGLTNVSSFRDVRVFLESLEDASNSILKVAPGVTESELTRCIDDALMPLVCELVVPRCDSNCNPMKPCSSLCVDVVAACPVLPQVLPLLSPGGVFEGTLGQFFPEPVDFSAGALLALADCDSSFWAGSTRGCSSSRFDGTRPDAEGACNPEVHEQRVQEYDEIRRNNPSEQADPMDWLAADHAVKLLLGLFAYCLPLIILCRTVSRKQETSWRPRRASIVPGNTVQLDLSAAMAAQAHARRGGRSPSAARSFKFELTGPNAIADKGAISSSSRVTSAEELSDGKTSRHVRISPSRDPSTSGTDDDIDLRNVKLPPEVLEPAAFKVIDWRNIAIFAMLLVSTGCTHQIGLTTEREGNVVHAIIFNMAALITFIVATHGMFGWFSLYEIGVRRYLLGHRSYRRMHESDRRNAWTRARYWFFHYKAIWSSWFGVNGKYFRARMHVFEAMEVTTQLLGVFDRIDVVPNSVLLVTVISVGVNVAGGCIFRMFPHMKHNKELSVFFELTMDCWYLLYGFFVTFDASAVTIAQTLGIVVPALISLSLLRTLNRMVVFSHAFAICKEHGLHRKINASSDGEAVKASFYIPSLRIDLASAQARRRACARYQRIGYVSTMFILGVCFSVSTVYRIVAQEAACAEGVGSLWLGVDNSEKRFLSDGFFAPADCHYDAVTYLQLSGTGIREVGDEVSEFSGLRSISAGANPDLTHVSPKIASLEELVQLDLADTPVETHLDWSFADVPEIPSVLFTMGSLETLVLRGNSISVLPEKLSQMSQLKHLDLSSNNLSWLGDSVGTLSQLSFLNVSNNMLSGVHPIAEDGLARVDVLDISHNRLERLPAVIGRSKYDSLSLRGNPVTRVDWSQQRLGSIPPELGDLPLVELDISQNQLLELPAAVCQATTLERLNLRSNAIQSEGIPESLSQLVRLKELDLGDNILGGTSGQLPDVLFSIPSLERLSLDCNQVEALPASIWGLPSLQYVSLGQNFLREFPTLDESAVAPAWTHVDISGTQLTSVPDELLQEPMASSLALLYAPDVGFSDLEEDSSSVEAATGLECAPDAVRGGLVCGERPQDPLWPPTPFCLSTGTFF